MTTTAKKYRFTPLFLMVGALFHPALADVGVPNQIKPVVSHRQEIPEYERSLPNAKQQSEVKGKNVAAEALNKACRIGEVAALNGDRLIKEIYSLNCYTDIFLSKSYQSSLFEESKMKTVSDEFVRLTNSYDSYYKSDELIGIMGYLLAGFEYRFYEKNKPELSYAVKQRLKQGFELMFNSPTSRSTDSDNKQRLRNAYRIIYYAEDYANYLPMLKAKLLEVRGDDFKDEVSSESVDLMFYTWNSVTNVDLNSPYIKDVPAFRIEANKIVRSDYSYFSAFKNFFENNRSLLGTKNEVLLGKAATNLAAGMYQ
ncbi:M9 family metallopeptidase N-terminal domain-containing protein [Chitinimonas sp. PSY-7]|uniref:M9 family metallopeptidase N-terminal domain-containing protein n=1 Tax=Chitinimonas sp. PSY-7 TaxID=3459088 RepID=UPI0040402A77